MANLRRHFNFTTKSLLQEREVTFTMTSCGKSSYRNFDKNSLMTNICNCLKLCCEYIQALNAVCEAGTLLAQNLFHIVREVSAFQTVSFQFLSIWEEVSKATAGASAAVKTETLMMLQEILNSLEVSRNESDSGESIAASFQGIGTCLYSFIELQAQFSFSTWKSFSKLSKHFTGDSIRHSLQWKSFEKMPKIVANTDLNATIKKHFSQLVSKISVSKSNESFETNHRHFHSSIDKGTSNVSTFLTFSNRSISNNAVKNSLWLSPTWSCNSSNASSRETDSVGKESLGMPPGSSDLDEVINLLSCAPVQNCNSKVNNENTEMFQHYANNEQTYPLLPLHPVSRCSANHSSWSKESDHIMVGFEPWLWRIDNSNNSRLQVNIDSLNLSPLHNDFQVQCDNREMKRWNNSICETGSSSDDSSSIHGPDNEYFSYGSVFKKYMSNPYVNRKHSSIESMPGILENISESKEDLWAVQSKISTWPLKQSSFKSSDKDYQGVP